MTSSGRLAVLSVVVAIGALAAYVLLLRVAVVRNHPEGYVVAFALAMALAALAVGRARARRWPAWLALGLSSLLLVGGAWFNFVVARVPDAPTVVRVGGGPDGQDVPRPATVVLDRDGVVRWFSVSRNFQVRPDPDDVLRAVRAL